MLAASAPLHRVTLVAGRCSSPTAPPPRGSSVISRQRLLEGDAADVADVIAPDVKLLEHGRPRGLQRLGKCHRPLPRTGRHRGSRRAHHCATRA
eukprot:scaffold115870_cov63-Phaeocystis_antarctica.AAC.2